MDGLIGYSTSSVGKHAVIIGSVGVMTGRLSITSRSRRRRTRLA